MKNYKHIHIITIICGLLLLANSLAGIFIPSFSVENFIPSQTVRSIIGIVLTIIIITIFHGPYECGDEMTELNIGKANKITLLLALMSIIAFAFIAQKNVNLLKTDIFISVVSALVAFRSILFLVLDRTPEYDTEEC
ncbi:MAG: hypothetical protein ACI4I6_04425 [Hominimerdicola sp.]